MTRKDHLDKIAKLLARFVEEVRSYNAANLYDINIHSENALIPILNAVYDIQLSNANSSNKKNFPAVDLIDLKNRIAFQVTATSTLEKITGTLKKFTEHELNKKFDSLYIVVLTGKQAKYSAKAIKDSTPDGFEFDEKFIIDVNDLIAQITYIQSLEKLQHIARLCEQEFSDVQIESRKKKYELGYLKNSPENIYVNLLEVSFPPTLYIGDLNIDIAGAKDKINAWRESKGWKPKKKFKQGELLRGAMIEANVFSGEWILRENKIHTFRNLYDSREGLSKFVDKGTIVQMGPVEYYLNSEDHLNNFKNLLRNCLIRLCLNKEIEWIADDEIFRFKNNSALPKQKQIRWKGKNISTKTVIFELWDKKKDHIICFRNMAFKPSFELYGDKWYLIVNPTWSFTNPGGRVKSRFESDYMAGIKRMENNNTVYYQYRFFAYHLSHTDLFTTEYEYLSLKPFVPFEFAPSLVDGKWLPPKEYEPKTEAEKQLSVDKELNQLF